MCKYIIDIMDENGNLFEWEKAKQKYDLNIFFNLSWLGLIKSIPTVGKSNLRNNFSGSPPRTELQNENMACIDSKLAYLKLIPPLSKPPTPKIIFLKGARIRQGCVEESLYVAMNSYIDSSLRSFQYKILNCILYLNERLYKFDIVDSPLCSLCGAYNESINALILHMYRDSETVNQLKS